MKQILLTASILISLFSFGQKDTTPIASRDIYNTIPRLALETLLSSAEIADNFYIVDGFSGYRLILNSNRSFVKVNFNCSIKLITESGSWKIKKGLLILNSKKGRQAFDVLRFDNYFILVSPNHRQSFINDFALLQEQYKDITPLVFESEEPWSKDRIVGYNLKNKYFISEIRE